MLNDTAFHHDLTIVVNTCDAYSDVLEFFFRALHNCWPDCPYQVVINTEQKHYPYSARIHNYSSPSGSDDWGARLLATLASIDTEYVLMLYDDFILDAPVDINRIGSALQLLQSKQQAVVTYLINTALPLKAQNSHDMFVEIKERSDYCLNSAPAIWRKQALVNYSAAGDTPWAWEVFGSYRTWSDGKLFYSLNPSQSDIYSYNHAQGGAIYRGKWVREVVEQLAEKYSFNTDWSQRGFTSDAIFEKRSLLWKFRFMRTGFSMVGFKALNFFVGYIKQKLHAA